MAGGWVDTILQWIFVMIGMIMTFFILLQEGKGGGLAALGGTKAAGVEGVTNPIRRATAYLAGLFFLLAIILGAMHKPKESVGLGAEAPPPAVEAAPAAGGAALKPIEVKPADVKPIEVKPADAPKTDAKPADAPKTDAKPAEGAKTDEKPADVKPAEAPKTDAKPADAKPAEAPKTNAPKPVEEPKK